eukprot:TRINITY_DN13926_c0_g2_i1.p1 TRINITY_DN13926_c0_g2~~TRINITY_DN13926_c0_g2_i1.p1  ORF type:complete len:325 (+),score=43.21 TRINITY_DN13926_c0_g2_i1:932-1906(+)
MFKHLRSPLARPAPARRALASLPAAPRRFYSPQSQVKPSVQCFWHAATNSCSYVVEDPTTKSCVVIDPVLDFDIHASRTWTEAADQIVAYITQKNLKNQYILETHCHADHVTASTYLKQKIGGSIAISKHIRTVQDTFAKVFNIDPQLFRNDGFDIFLDETFNLKLGNVTCKILETPGHTPACLTYVLGDSVFVGDTVFMPDYGCARCDFPGGSAEQLFKSITQKTYTLPDTYRLFCCHDYLPENGRTSYQWECTVKDQKDNNVWIKKDTNLEDFVSKRKARDSKLSIPKLLYPSLQLNLRAGQTPPAEENGKSYLKYPLTSQL